MTTPFTRLLRTPLERMAFRRVASALVVLALGCGTLVTAWVHWMVTSGYAAPAYLVETFGRYVQGEPLTVLGIVAFGPMLEEVLFRGLLLTALLWFWRPWIAVFAAALLFAALHFNLLQIMPAVLMGIILGTVYARTGSLVLCWLGHAIYNAQVGMTHAVLGATAGWPNGFPPPGAPGTVPMSAWVFGVASILIGGALLWSSLRRVPFEARPRWRQPTAVRAGDGLTG